MPISGSMKCLDEVISLMLKSIKFIHKLPKNKTHPPNLVSFLPLSMKMVAELHTEHSFSKKKEKFDFYH